MLSKSGNPLRLPRASACSMPQTTPTRCWTGRCSCTLCASLHAFIYDTLHMAVADFPIGFIAKATLFNLPIFGTILRWAGAIPIHRAQDAPAATSGAPSRAASNKGAFSEISNRLRQNGHVAIFPEGISHMEAHVMPLYTGITRMALDAVQGIVGAYI